MITRTDLLTRARSALVHPAKYRLGGGFDSPEFDSPLDNLDSCDCSQFICWCLGLKKFDKGRTWLNAVNGGYFSTDGVWWDAVKTEMGLFNMIGWGRGDWPMAGGVRTLTLPGDVIVYPALWVARGANNPALNLHLTSYRGTLPGIGHIALITNPTPDASGKPLVIDCSAAVPGNAIREHRWFPTHPAAIVARCSLVGD